MRVGWLSGRVFWLLGTGVTPLLGPYSHGDLRRQRLITSPPNEKVHKDARRCIVVFDFRPSRVPPAVCVEGGECCTFHLFVTVAIERVLWKGKSRRLKNAHAPLPWGKDKEAAHGTLETLTNPSQRIPMSSHFFTMACSGRQGRISSSMVLCTALITLSGAQGGGSRLLTDGMSPLTCNTMACV